MDLCQRSKRTCIKFIEQKTGAKWNWDAYFTQIKRFNKETEYELQKWEVNKSAYPQLLGPCYELFRKWCYETFENDRIIGIVVMATPEDLAANAE